MKSERLRALSVPTVSSELAALGSTRLDHWALGRIQQAVAPAPLRFVLWDGYAIGPDRHARRHDHDQEPGRPLQVAVESRPQLRRRLHVGRGRRPRRSGARCSRPSIARWATRRRGRGGCPSRATRSTPRAKTCTITTTSATSSTSCGSIERWCTRARISRRRRPSLEDAQIAKMALVSRKLRLKPGERVVEAGCGWGSLALFMAREHGVRVTAFNISREQIAYAREQARRRGSAIASSSSRTTTGTCSGTCDAFVSVGMLEHVGLPDYATLGDVMDRVLTEDGRGLLHFIGRNKPAPLNPWIAKRIFPGRVSADARRGVRAHPSAARLFGPRRREHPAALRQDARALAAAVPRRHRTA